MKLIDTVGKSERLRAMFVVAWLELRLHHIRIVLANNGRGWKWMPCDRYGRFLPSDQDTKRAG
jgi:hypothetical protein